MIDNESGEDYLEAVLQLASSEREVHSVDVARKLGVSKPAVTKAMKILRSRLYNMKQKEQADKISAERKDQVGSGDRSERIRTYNFPQGRVTDHRIGMTIYRLEEFLNGDIDEMLNALIANAQAEKLKSAID